MGHHEAAVPKAFQRANHCLQLHMAGIANACYALGGWLKS
jgi:hypothetical protein